MGKQHKQPLRNNCRQLALVVLGFVLCISLLESKGFVIWAQRLEVSTTQQNILSVIESIDGALSTVAAPVTGIRPKALEFLRQHGWSDMPIDTRIGEQVDVDTEEGEKGVEVSNNAPDSSALKDVENMDKVVKDGNTVIHPQSEEVEQGHQKPALPEGWLPLAQPKEDHQLIPLPALQAKQSRRVVMAGDSMMAVGLAAQLQREFVAFKSTVSTVRAYRSATGLARPDVFDWQKEYPLMIGNKKPDVVIVAIGANDTQNFEVNRKVLAIGSDEWRKVYTQRLTDYLDMLTKDGAVVLWIKLPPMRPNKYNNDVKVVNEVAEQVVVQNPCAIWWDVSARFLNDKGKYYDIAALTAGQRQVRIRQVDGIHLTDSGAQLITKEIVTWLNLEPPEVEAVDVKPAVIPDEISIGQELENMTADEANHGNAVDGNRSVSTEP